MSRVANPVPQYFDSENKILSGGLMFYFEVGTTTPKNTFADIAETIPNPHPVILDSEGRLPNVFFTGAVRQVLQNSSLVQVWERDDVGDTAEVYTNENIGRSALSAKNLLDEAEVIFSEPTTLDLINTSLDLTNIDIFKTSGFSVLGDGGDELWARNGTTGQTPSQTPKQLAVALLNDPSGNQWALVNNGRFHVKALGVVGDGIVDDFVAINACLNHSENTKAIIQGGGLSIMCRGKLLVGDNVTINMPTDIFIKGYISAESNTDALFTNKSYAVLGTPNTNISIDGLNIINEDPAKTGAFISFNWIDGLNIKNFDLVNTGAGWTAHISAKNLEVDKIKIDSSLASPNADGIHFEYIESATISNLNINSEDDCLALHYQPGVNSSAGPNLSAKNITITNLVLSSSTANGIRIGTGSIGNTTESDTVVANAQFDGVEISNVTINKLGATGRSLALYDERTAATLKHDNISITDVYLNDENSVAGQIQIIGNEDITDNANIGIKNFDKVFINNFNMFKSGGGQFQIGGIEKLVFDNLNFESTDTNTHPIDCRQVTDLQFKNSDMSSLATSRILLARDIQKFTWNNNVSKTINTATATIQFEQPTINDADIFIKNNVFEEGASTFATLSAVTCRTFHHVANSRVSVTNTNTGTVTATASKVVDDYN